MYTVGIRRLSLKRIVRLDRKTHQGAEVKWAFGKKTPGLSSPTSKDFSRCQQRFAFEAQREYAHDDLLLYLVFARAEAAAWDMFSFSFFSSTTAAGCSSGRNGSNARGLAAASSRACLMPSRFSASAMILWLRLQLEV